MFPLPASLSRVVPALGIALCAVSASGPRSLAEPAPPRRYVPGRVIVQLRDDAVEKLRRESPAAIPRFLARHGVSRATRATRPLPRLERLDRRFGLDRLFVLDVPQDVDAEGLARALAAEPGVLFAHPDWIGEGGATEATTSDTKFPDLWHLKNTAQGGGVVDADVDGTEAWTVATGRREIRVAVLDSGIDGDHREFVRRIAPGGMDFQNGDLDPEDDHNHGTLVSGVLGAVANNRFVVAGVDWRARIVPIKVLDHLQMGTTSTLVEGLRHAAAIGADVANLSLIRYPDSPALAAAVDLAHAAGVLLVGCNGNDGTTEVNYPAGYPGVLSVGWTDRSDERFFWSNHTPTLDLVAPGFALWSVARGMAGDMPGSFYGCSAATPVVTGVASLLLALDPTLTFEQLETALVSTADDEVGDPVEDVPGRDDHHGWGRLNADRALRSLGLVSAERLHVESIELERVSATRIEVRVAVADDLSGAEPGVKVFGTLVFPQGIGLPLSPVVTASTAVATFAYSSGMTPLPAGEWGFVVTDLVRAGAVRDSWADVVSYATYDPDLESVSVQAVTLSESEGALRVDVEVVDDDGHPEGNVLVEAALTLPSMAPVPLSAATTLWSQGGAARLTYAPAPESSLPPGTYSVAITGLSKSGHVYDPSRNRADGALHERLDPQGDPDGDGVPSVADDCPLAHDALQADADGDGIGDACDVCPTRIDTAQEDTDGDGAGDRCDCAPWDASRVRVGEVESLVPDPDRTTWRWNGVSGADHYDVLRGTLAELRSGTFGTCLSNDLAGREIADAEVPTTGHGWFYLVRAGDAVCPTGSLGAGSSGAERVNATPDDCPRGDLRVRPAATR